jgi:hypothetical protein
MTRPASSLPDAQYLDYVRNFVDQSADHALLEDG